MVTQQNMKDAFLKLASKVSPYNKEQHMKYCYTMSNIDNVNKFFGIKLKGDDFEILKGIEFCLIPECCELK